MSTEAQPGLLRQQTAVPESREGWGTSVRASTAVHLEQVATVEAALYAGAVLLGLLLRLLLLDQRPLSAEEGSLALQSYRVMLGQMPDVLRDGPLPTYGTALALGMFGGGDAAARLFSVLAGTSLVLSPYLLRASLGKTAALLAAFGLALSPLVLFASRDVGSGIVPAALSVLLWWTVASSFKSADRRWPYATALILAGLLACGPAGVTAALSLGIAGILAHPSPSSLAAEARRAWAQPIWRQAGLLFLVAIIAIGAALGANLRGVQSVLVDVWVSWLGSLSIAAPRGSVLVTIGLYELPILLIALGRLGVTILRRERTDMFLSLWMMTLLLLSMLQATGALSRVILPVVPAYLLAARAVAGSLPIAARARASWKWTVGFLGVIVPLLVAVVLLNRAAVLRQEVPAEFLYGEAALVLCGILISALVLDGPGRSSVAWGATAVLSIGFILHTAIFLNYRMDSVQSEFVAGQEVTPFLREAATEAAYFSTYYGTNVTVDPQLRPAVEWYLRNGTGIAFSGGSSQGITIQLAQQAQASLPATSERSPALYTPMFDTASLSWRGLWSWLVTRDGLVRTNQRDIILRAPAGDW
jgi:hypothetical protein